MLEFVKAHANGNDFIILEREPENPADFAIKYCRPKTGIGADGLILVELGKGFARLRFFNPDGSQPDFCGNGAICIAGYLHRFHGMSQGILSTRAGDLEFKMESDSPLIAKIQMPSPKFRRFQIPALGDPQSELILSRLDGFPYPVSGVNTGVPHAVVFLKNIDRIKLGKLGPKLRYHPIFPQGANVDFVEITQDGIKLRTYERGLESESLACGSGALAAASICWKLGRMGSDRIKVISKGGILWISREGDRYYLSSKLELVFKAQLLSHG